MDVLVTGAYGRCGTALIDHLHGREEYDFTYFNRSDRPDDHPYGGYDTYVGDVCDYEAIRDATEGHDAVVHLAAYPHTDGSWEDVHGPNIEGMRNALRAAREADVESFVFGSTNHVMGEYETEHAPGLYFGNHGLALDHTDPVRPDSYYGTSKAFGEALGRQFVEDGPYPERFYALRICTVGMPENDHPYADAEPAVREGEIERGSAAYERMVGRRKAMWHSRRDFAHLVDCCLGDETVEFGIFSGVSDNDRRWYSIEHARSTLGYSPADNGDDWEGPPEPDQSG